MQVTLVIVIAVAALGGVGLVVAGVYILAGPGWSLVVAAVPFLVFAAVMLRGVIRAG